MIKGCLNIGKHRPGGKLIAVLAGVFFAAIAVELLSFVYFRAHHSWSYQAFFDRVRNSGLIVVNLGPDLMEGLANREVDSLFNRTKHGTHHNREGNALVAKALARELKKLNGGPLK